MKLPRDLPGTEGARRLARYLSEQAVRDTLFG